MEFVHLVECHQVEQLLDLLLAVEVAGDIEHQAAPGIMRRIGDIDGRDAPATLGRLFRFDLIRKQLA